MNSLLNKKCEILSEVYVLTSKFNSIYPKYISKRKEYLELEKEFLSTKDNYKLKEKYKKCKKDYKLLEKNYNQVLHLIDLTYKRNRLLLFELEKYRYSFLTDEKYLSNTHEETINISESEIEDIENIILENNLEDIESVKKYYRRINNEGRVKRIR